MSRLANEPQCMSLEGVTGAGKSTLVQDYLALFYRIEKSDGTRIPIFYAETPSPVTVKGMAATLLAHLGDLAAHHGTLLAMNFRLIHLMMACQLELVILDDFHHLIDKETNRILETNAQLSRLFAVRQTLQPFRCDPSDEGSVQEFARFVQYAEQVIGVPLPATPPRLELLHCLHYATGGVVGNLMNLLRYAAWITRQSHQEVMTLPILATAFDKRLAKHVKKPANPFLAAPNEAFVAKPVMNAENPVGKRRQPSAAQYCPHCLKSAAYHRLSWIPISSTTCLEHSCLLTSRCPQCHKPISIQEIVWQRCRNCLACLSSANTLSIEDDELGILSQHSIQSWLMDGYVTKSLDPPSQHPAVLYDFLEYLARRLLYRRKD